ncbi:MAG TPA: hypothetical protein VJN90_10070 [Candidatus Acidoferrales bacterium]|nr:hypothetical protein [Candidatus Acidoferrales bacterium]
MMRYLAHLAISILAGVLALGVTFSLVGWLQIAIYGQKVSDNDAGAEFSVVAFALGVGVIFGVAIFAVVFETLRQWWVNAVSK